MNYIIFTLLLSTLIFAAEADFLLKVNSISKKALFYIDEAKNKDISAITFSKVQKASYTKGITYTNAFDYLSSLSLSNTLEMNVVSVGSSANITANKTIKIPAFEEATAIIKTTENGYIVSGYTQEGSLSLIKLDSSDNLVYNNSFGDKKYDTVNKLILLKDGAVLAVGASITQKSNDLYKSAAGLSALFITKFSKDGTIIWSKKYEAQNEENGIDAVETLDGSLIVLSSTSSGKNKSVNLIRIHNNGDKIWLKNYKNENKITPYKIIKLKNSNFLVSLSEQNGEKKEQVRLLQFDLDQKIVMDKLVETTYASVLNDIKEYPDATIVGIGNVKDAHNTDALVMVLDAKLNLVNQEHYGQESYDDFKVLCLLGNSGAAAVGINTDEKSKEQKMWIAKLNRDGTLAKKK